MPVTHRDSGRHRRRLEASVAVALAHLGDVEGEAVLEAIMVHPDENVRARLLPVLVRQHRERKRTWLPFIEHGLSDRSFEVRRAALKTAFEFPDDRLIPRMAPLLSDRHHEIRAMASAFIRWRPTLDPALLEPVLQVVRSPRRSKESRIRAIQALAYPHDVPQIAEALLAALDDADAAVRRHASHAFTSIRTPDPWLRRLEERLSQNRPAEIHLSALWAMALAATPTVAPLLKRYLTHRDARFQEAAVAGLDRLRDPALLEALRALWQELQAESRSSFSGPG